MSGAPLYGNEDDETQLQPDAPRGSLVEPEGVNAGSADTTGDEDEHVPGAGAARTGGAPEDAEEQIGAAGAAEDEAGPADAGQFVGQPSEDPGFPSGRASGSSGQDAGSMG